MIPVTKPYLPNRDKLNRYIDGIYERNWLTNNGPLVQELTRRLEEYLGVENLLLVANGTLALQIAYHALGINLSVNGKPAEAITTPFTFIATASSLKWDGIEPVFVDIDPESWCLDPNNIEAAITENTRAIVPVHVFGNACDVEAIDGIAQKHSLKVIYDGCHAFGVKYKGESLLKHGDAATLSFHATKLFHTGEGGAIVFKRKEDLERAKKMVNFGITCPETIEELGINAKMNELQAAMGLCVLDEMEGNLNARRSVWTYYENELKIFVKLQKKSEDLSYNFAYFPAVFETELQATVVAGALKESGVLARRYFYPSLENVERLGTQTKQPVSSDIASRILCLPVYDSLALIDQIKIVNTVSTACYHATLRP
jgi:dTDP-4-amino-4,6-dideoxygalactose transaminase